jgi:hypothetical protein
MYRCASAADRCSDDSDDDDDDIVFVVVVVIIVVIILVLVIILIMDKCDGAYGVPLYDAVCCVVVIELMATCSGCSSNSCLCSPLIDFCRQTARVVLLPCLSTCLSVCLCVCVSLLIASR